MLKINKNCGRCYGRGVNKVQDTKTAVSVSGHLVRQSGFNTTVLKLCGCVSFICPNCSTKKNVKKMHDAKFEGNTVRYICLCNKREIVITVKEEGLSYECKIVEPKESMSEPKESSILIIQKPVD